MVRLCERDPHVNRVTHFFAHRDDRLGIEVTEDDLISECWVSLVFEIEEE
jgi:hypothetical protein